MFFIVMLILTGLVGWAEYVQPDDLWLGLLILFGGTTILCGLMRI
jgi:hypothetical protein